MIAPTSPSIVGITASEIDELDATAAIAEARARIRRSEMEAARALLDHALRWARAREDTSAESMALAAGATLAMRAGDYPKAAAQGEEALLSAGPFANARASAEACLTLSMVYADIGLSEEAMRLAEDARTFAQRANDVGLLSWAHTRIGDARALKQNLYGVPALVQSLPDYRTARRLARASGDTDPMIAALNNLMRAVADTPLLGDGLIPPIPKRVIQLAALAGARAMALIREVGNLQAAHVVEPNYGAVLCKSGRFEEGTQLLESCLARVRINSKVDSIYCLVSLGIAYNEAGQTAAGRAWLLEGLATAKELGYLPTAALIRHLLFREAKNRGDVADALHQLEQASLARQAQYLDQTKIRETIDARVRRLREALWQVAHARMDAETDPLTNVFNRRGFPEKLSAAAALAKFERLPYAIAMIDIDYFKKINDAHGHAVGDQVLKAVAQTLKANCRDVDLLGRYGGDEFVLGAMGASKAALAARCEQFRAAIAGIDFKKIGLSAPVSISVGVSELNEAGDTDALVQMADARLYYAKRSGRNRVELERIK